MSINWLPYCKRTSISLYPRVVSVTKITSIFFLITLFFFFSTHDSSKLYAVHTQACTFCKPHPNLYCPWFTSPLIIPFRYVVEYPLTLLEPYLYITTEYAKYDNHWTTRSNPNFVSTSISLIYDYGFYPRFDYQIMGQFSWNQTQGVSDWVINDTLLYLDYQFLMEDYCKWYPSIKLGFIGVLPTGKYQRLNPKKLETDLGGLGNWAPGLLAVFSKRFILGSHFFYPMFSASYNLGVPVNVKGANAYGGGHGTKGRIHPGNELTLIFSYEFTFNQNWVLACDHIYIHRNRSRFSGRVGKTNGVPNTVGEPSSEQFSLAPAIEYNWSANGGVITGVWFTVAGRNSEAFASYVTAAYVQF